MKSVFTKGLIIICVFLFNNTATFAEDLLKYDLTKEKIKKVCVYEGKKGLFEVSVELNKKSRDVFSELTGNNVGNMLMVTLLGKVLSKAKIMGKIDSGIISVGELDSAGTIKIIEEILLLYGGDKSPTHDPHRPEG